jgi:hypothetical protein
MSVEGSPDDRTWAEYREEVFGSPYLVWHDGPYFEPIADDFAEDPGYVLAMVRKGILEDDAVAAQVPREVRASEEQKAALVAMLEEVMPQTQGGTRTEVATSLHALGGAADLAREVVAVLLAEDQHWSVRLDAAQRLALFAPTAELVAAAARGVQAGDYLVRYHSANTLLRWAGRPELVSDDAELFGLLVDDAGASEWAEAADRLAAGVPLPL